MVKVKTQPVGFQRFHDEVIVVVDKPLGSVEEFEAIMATVPDWAEAESRWQPARYIKD